MLADQDLSLVRSFEQGPSTVCPFPTVTAAFYNYAVHYPDAVAARDMASSPMRELSYRELALEAQSLARNLRQLGVGPGQRVPLFVKRGLEMVVSIWAVLSCGAQYVPLDGGVVPESTIRTVVEQSGGKVVICVPATEQRLKGFQGLDDIVPIVVEVKEQQSGDALAAPEKFLDLATADSGCYVIYTSGTTGKPKGVDVTHKNVANLVCQSPGNLGVRPGTSVGSILNISFDMAAWEIFTCMCNGGTLVMRGSKWEPTLHQINVLICTPTILSRYHPDTFPQIKAVATAGEASSQNLADLWASRATYWNCCGPTETTIVNTMCKHVVGQPLSIGRPTPNNTVYILDSNMQHVAAGVPGTMWAGGHGISRGYVGLPQRTAESYLPDPFANDGSKMYNTGDLGSWMPDGQIEIIGRADDQVKVKGFRVELDGITSTIASFPGVTRATVLLIEGQLHAYVSPGNLDVPSLIAHVKRSQPYYAVPSTVHALEQLPSTANGKIDKKALAAKTKEDGAAAAAAATAAPVKFAETAGVVDPEKAIVIATASETTSETRSVHSTTTTTTEGAKDLVRDIPDKRHGQPFRGLRHRVFIVYRRLLSLVWLVNLGALIALIVKNGGSQWLAILTAANLVTCVLIRQDSFINLLYTVACSVPTSWPLWIRSRCAEIYHLGGVHSGAGICATIWLYISTIRSTVDLVSDGDPIRGKTLAVLVLSWMLCALCGSLVLFAYPTIRKAHHDLFERVHRFVGWTALAIFWVRLVLTVDNERSQTVQLGLALARSPIFWMLIVASLCIASSWFWLRKVPVEAEILSDHAVRLHFKYTTPVNGSFARLSRRPLIEWHSFATIPYIESESGKGYSLVVSNAGDWTRNIISNAPTNIWVRGLPTCGVMRIATLFNRVVLIATGSGIGPVLGHINSPSCPTQLIWSTPNPEKTFGKKMCDGIRKSIPGAVIHDTRSQGRPDLVRMGYNMARGFGAEAVIIIANEKITKKVVYGLQSRGMPAYGAIWDS